MLVQAGQVEPVEVVLREDLLAVWTPDLPNTNDTDINKWVDFVLSNKDWQFDEDSIIIGHSSGATTILGLLQKLPKNTKINKALLVAGFVKYTTIP